MLSARFLLLASLSVILISSTMTSHAADENWSRPTAVAAQANTPPVINGAADDTCWNLGGWNENFVNASAGPENSGQPHPAVVQSRFKVAWDTEALYLLVECDEPQIEALKRNVTGHDGMTFTDDCIELFFDASGDGRYYQHFVVNSNGAWYDDTAADWGLVFTKTWDCPISVASQVDAINNKWTVEMRIPLGAIDLPAVAPQTWLWNITRERYAAGEAQLHSWAPLKGNFHQPKYFGTLSGLDIPLNQFRFAVSEPAVRMTVNAEGMVQGWPVARVRNETGQDVTLIPTVANFGTAQTQQSEPVLLPAGQDMEVAFPPVAPGPDGKTAHVTLSLLDAQTGQLRKAVVKRLPLEYKALKLNIKRPVYRNCIFASEAPKRIEFTVQFGEGLKAQTKVINCELVNEAGVVIAKQTLQPDAFDSTVTFAAEKLPDGRYLLKAQAMTADNVSLGKVEVSLRKLPPPPTGNEVRVDELGNVLLNGVPKVCIGWYAEVPTNDPRADVVALQNISTPAVPIDCDPAGIRENWEKHGIYSVVSMENSRFTHIFKLWQKENHPVPTEHKSLSAPSEEMRGLVRQLIEAMRGEPGLIGYYIADEPEINDYRKDYIEALYQLLVEEDPYHPVMVTNNTLDGIVQFGYRCADILNPDPYSPNLEYVPNFMKRCQEVMQPGQTIWTTLWHSTGRTHFTHDWGSAPAYAYRIFRNQYLVSLAFGSRGWTGYTSAFFMPEIEYRYGLPHVWRELKFLESAIGAPALVPAPVVTADNELAVWLREAQGHVYLVVVNYKPGARDVQISHPLLAKYPELFVVSEDRNISLRDGILSDHFAEGDARIYTSNPAGKNFSTTKQVEAELAQLKADCVKPGNLLHSDHGVRATASEGYYAPWFTQYYYYAINGITDDIGWQASHSGDKPSWVEFTLPEPKQVARLVLYTPNLKDYDIQLTGPNGESYQLEVKDNQELVVEHRFNPVACLKIRVTQYAAREGKSTLAEIEAYSEPGGEINAELRQITTAQADIIGGALPAPDGENILWSDNFSDFRHREAYRWDGTDNEWVYKPENLETVVRPEGGITIHNLIPQGSGMTHIFPYAPQYRWLQVKLGNITGEGYQFINFRLGHSSGEPDFRNAINTSRPGIYTVDTHYINEQFAKGERTDCIFSTYSLDIFATIDWIQLVQRPENGLAVTLGDGSPLPDEVQQGDELLFRVMLAKPAADIVVDAMADWSYAPLLLNGAPYIQLVKTGAKDGTEWAGRVLLGEGTGKFDCKASGYPLVFRGRIAGGEVNETWASAMLSIK